MRSLASTVVFAAEQSDGDTSWFDHLRGVAEIAGGVVAAGIILGVGRAVWLRSFGRRRAVYRRLRRLGTNARLSFFEAVLGEPPTIKRTVTGKRTDYVEEANFEIRKVEHPRDFREYIWIDPDFFVQAVTDDEDTVLAFSVTARNPRFNPRFRAMSESCTGTCSRG
jgi:hypothetical protein